MFEAEGMAYLQVLSGGRRYGASEHHKKATVFKVQGEKRKMARADVEYGSKHIQISEDIL